MAFDAEELAQIAELVNHVVESKIPAVAHAEEAAQANPVVQAMEKAAEFYTHLADGRVVTLPEDQAAQSHYEGVRIIDKYQVGE